MTRRVEPPLVGYDVIGDVHGCARELVELLTVMGYVRQHGTWRHPLRKAVFVGDLIDRGPEIVEVLETVAAMVEAGTAVCVLGNHERDFIYYNVELTDGKPLRARNEIRAKQLEATHKQLERIGLTFWLDWCRRLPILFEAPGLRVSHAAWNDHAAEFWRGRNLSDADLCAKLADRESLPSQYLDWLLFGPYLFYEQQEQQRGVRMRWFNTSDELAQRSVWHAAFHRNPSLPRRALTSAEQSLLWGYPASRPVLVNGHQSLPLSAPLRPMRRNLACVDYSAVFGGRLCAYRWSGERWLSREGFVAVPARAELRTTVHC